MEILTESLAALGQVVAVGLLLGAGLPALFALGVRALETDRVLLSDRSGEFTSHATAGGKALAVLCFGVTALAVVLGIVVIIFGRQLFGS